MRECGVEEHHTRGKAAAFCALSPKPIPLRVDSVTSRLRKTLDGINKGTERKKRGPSPMETSLNRVKLYQFNKLNYDYYCITVE